MPPCLDIYVISQIRTRSAVERFLEMYVDRGASDSLSAQELMMLPPGASKALIPFSSWEWEPAQTLGHVVNRGLAQPWRAFAVYLKAQSIRLHSAILAFTVDGRVIFGASLDDPDGRSENFDRAIRLLHELAQEFSASAGFIAVEEPPPLLGDPPPEERVLHRWIRDAV